MAAFDDEALLGEHRVALVFNAGFALARPDSVVSGMVGGAAWGQQREG
jgi:hypothetical protein